MKFESPRHSMTRVTTMYQPSPSPSHPTPASIHRSHRFSSMRTPEERSNSELQNRQKELNLLPFGQSETPDAPSMRSRRPRFADVRAARSLHAVRDRLTPSLFADFSKGGPTRVYA